MPKYPEEQIRNYAHQLWEKAGCPEGKSDDFWRQAETELDAEGETNEPTTAAIIETQTRPTRLSRQRRSQWR
jgi:hypothetical protein